MEDLTAILLPFMIISAWLFLLALSGVMLSQDADRNRAGHAAQTALSRPLQDLAVDQVMRQAVFYFSPETTGIEIAQTMTTGGFGSVPIVDEQYRVIGIVSEFDLLNAIQEGQPLETITARDIMTSMPISATEAMSLHEVIRILQSRHLIRVPVTDEAGMLMGIVARRDILKGYVESCEAQHAAA